MIEMDHETEARIDSHYLDGSCPTATDNWFLPSRTANILLLLVVDKGLKED